MKKIILLLLISTQLFISCSLNKSNDNFTPINGFSQEANAQLKEFFEKYKNSTERKIAVFDGDGTVIGQTPHYLADECMYQFALENPSWHKEIIDTMIQLSNVSLPYVQYRVKYISGKSLQFYRDLGEKTFNKYYKHKIFPPVKELIKALKNNDFEIWIVTASPEGMYQQFLSKEFDIPLTNIVGVKSVIKNGIITDEIVFPVPQDEGKKEAIETFIQDQPLFAAGNSRGDKEMIEFGKDLRMIVNPDEHIAEGQTQSIADYAKEENWLIIKIDDIPSEDFPSISSKNYGIRLNKTTEKQTFTISKEVLKDKIAGGWAGKMIGVTYGAPTEFKAQGKTFEDSIKWKPADVKGSVWQDDIYVQLTFMETMDKYGLDAPAKKFHELFAKSGYMLWHANVQGRKNYFDGIYPPLSGNPEFNLHADDIDFQIEADYIGFICPGMPQSANKIADKIGHIMNYGDGVYGGVFVAALYSEAFLEKDVSKIVDKALLSIPAKSDYAKIINDVIILHKHYPTDWRKAWQELDNKWGKVNICEAGKTFNIDAKLNGAYIIMGLLYGDGDVDKTMEIATRCGQDSDCNPSNAVAVLGVIKGFSGLPLEYQSAVEAISDSLFDNTSYSFNKAVSSTMKYAQEMITKNGGIVEEENLTIKIQTPVAFPLEDAFPKLVFDKRINVFDLSTDGWKTKGIWTDSNKNQSKFSNKAGDEISLTFEGTGVSIEGNWVKDGGMADVFVDGVFKRTIDCYFDYARQEHRGINIFHILNLPEGKHTVRLVIKDTKNPKSTDTNIYVSEAVIYKTTTKTNENFKFTFQ